MAFSAVFYKTNKRANSTFIPTGTYLDTMVTLKENVSIIAPNLIINFPDATITEYNYVYIAALNRRYFVTEWRSVNATTWECSCAVDVLASYKTDIGAQSHYVLRSASAFDPLIIDSKYIMKANVEELQAPVTSYLAENFIDGCYILGIINADNQTATSVTYYALDDTAMRAFKSWMMTDPAQYSSDPWSADINEDTVKFLFNPYQYISSIEWFPISYANITGTTTPILFGWWSTGINAKRIGNPRYQTTIAKSVLHKHRLGSTRGSYLYYAPFTQYRLYFPPIGDFDLDAEMCAQYLLTASGDYIEFNIVADIDLMSGIGYVHTESMTGSIINLFRSEVKFSIPIAVASVLSNSTAGDISSTKQIINMGQNLASAALGVGASAASGNIGGAVASGISLVGEVLSIPNTLKTAAYDALAARSPQVQIYGNNGGNTAYKVTKFLKHNWLIPVNENNEEFGRPLYQVKVLNTLSGFIQCVDAISNCANATLQEQNLITQFLNGGFFYE